MLASSISQDFGVGWPGVPCRGLTWLTARLGMSSHLRSVNCCRLVCTLPLFPPRPSHLSWQVFVFPLVSVTAPGGEGGGCRSQGCHDTLHIWLGLIPGPTLLFRHHSPSSSIVDEFNLRVVLVFG